MTRTLISILEVAFRNIYNRTDVQRANQNRHFSYCTKLIVYKCTSIDVDSLFIDNPVKKSVVKSNKF